MATPKDVFKKRKQAGKGKPFTKKNAAEMAKKKKHAHKPNYELEERIVRNIDKSIISRYINLNSHLTVDEMKAKLENRGSIPFMEYMIIRAMVVCAQTGDPSRLSLFLDRTAGKVEQKIQHSVDDPYASKSNEELIQMKKQLETRNREIMNNIEKLPRYQEQQQNLKDATPVEELEEVLDLDKIENEQH